jgi:hypothetical protein
VQHRRADFELEKPDLVVKWKEASPRSAVPQLAPIRARSFCSIARALCWGGDLIDQTVAAYFS